MIGWFPKPLVEGDKLIWESGMKMHQEDILRCDVLVIGGGGAGLRAAIAAVQTGASVWLTSKAGIGKTSNTYISKGVIAASGLGQPEDHPDIHAADTVAGGRFLNDPEKIGEITRRAADAIRFLYRCGAGFSMDGDKFRLMHTGGHRYPRHVFGRNWKGSDIVTPLKRYAAEVGVRFLEHVFITRLLTVKNRILGACGLTSDGRLIPIQASAVILATGGYAQVFRNTNNVPGITGDGHTLCYDLGVPLQDMEFVQFYPTARGGTGSSLLLNERLLAQPETALTNHTGEDILKRYGVEDFLKVTRDQLAQMVMRESREGPVVMDLSRLPDDKARAMAPLIPPVWWKGQKMYPVVPTAHFCMGGVKTDPTGQTAVNGLFAVGELTAGAHGANRLGGNALAEIFTLGEVVGHAAGNSLAGVSGFPAILDLVKQEKEELEKRFSDQGISLETGVKDLKERMWEHAGIIRNPDGLRLACDAVSGPCPDIRVTSPRELIRSLEYRNLRLVSEMICRAALMRTESRGSHFRTDFPEEDDSRWLRNILIEKGASGMQCSAPGIVTSV